MRKDDIVLNDRKRELLLSAVESYIDNALPITSGKIHKDLFSDLSSATLRNELNTLEEMGFLHKLHISSGRVPTTKAYRYFVNSLIQSNEFNPEEITLIKNKFINRSTILSEILDSIAKSIGEITQLPTYVQLRGIDELVLQGINVIPLLTGQALVLFKTNAGVISNTINLSDDMTDENCKDASKILTTNLYNKKIREVIENIDYYNGILKNQIKFYQELFVSLTELLKQYCSTGSKLVKNINASQLLDNPDHKDIGNAKKFINLIENEKELKNIIENINQNSESEIIFSIGEENKNENLNEYSIIQANYSLSSGIEASIGVVGYKRMDYAKIASALKFIMDQTRDLNINNDAKNKGDNNV